MIPFLRSAALLCLASLALACGARYARVPLVETPDLVVALRSEKPARGASARAFSHPATLSVPRAESILSRIEVRAGGDAADERRPAFRGELVHTLGAALADALARADATQEVVIRAQRRERRLGVFTRRFATRFIAFVDAQGRLQIHLVDSDRELPPGDETPLAEPIAGTSTQPFKALPGPHVEAIGARAVAVDWRADLFSAPPLRDEPGRRRTILMETAQPNAPKPAVEAAAPTTSPERLRSLAELDAARRAGEISEAEYQRRRAALQQPAGN